MSVYHDYKCKKHGYFENNDPVCPRCGTTEVTRVFLKPPSYKSQRTKTADQTLRGLASDFKMTDIKSTREGEAQDGYFARNNKPEPRQPRPGDQAVWGGAKGLNMESLLRGNAIKSIHGESVGINPQEAGVSRGPMAASYIPDHEGLKIKK